MSCDSTILAFCRDVLAYLQRRRVTFRGCAAINVVWHPDGSLDTVFAGLRAGKVWKGRVSQKCLVPADAGTHEIAAASDPAFIGAEIERALPGWRLGHRCGRQCEHFRGRRGRPLPA